MDNRTQPLTDGVWRVEVGVATNAFVLADDGRGDSAGLTVVDTGGRSGGPRLVRSIRMLGLDPRAVHRVLLTHWHPDHAGSAAAFARSSAAPQVLVGAGDLDVVTGRQARPHAALAAENPTVTGRLVARAGAPRPPKPVPGARPLHGDERLDVGTGLEVVAAPGHTPGHCAFWLPAPRLLLAGDAVWHTLAVWRGPAFLRSEAPSGAATLRRLAALAPGVVAPSHGPPIARHVAERLERLAARAERGP